MRMSDSSVSNATAAVPPIEPVAYPADLTPIQFGPRRSSKRGDSRERPALFRNYRKATSRTCEPVGKSYQSSSVWRENEGRERIKAEL